MKLIVLGGGIAGISAAYHAKLSGVDATVLEARDRAGGLTDSFEVGGFTFDHAIHLSFTKDSYVRSIFDQTPFNVRSPDAWCLENETWLKHPVQNNLYPIPVEDRINLIKGFFSRPDITPTNYGEWLSHQYGDAIAERFPARYTRKYWATEPTNLGLEWVGGRMRRASADEILLGAMSEKTGNGYYAEEMRYPQAGGYRRFLEPMLPGLDILTGKHTVSVDTRRKVVQCLDGSTYDYDNLISTIPLPQLVGMIRDCPAEIRELSTTLWATQVDIVSFGVRRPMTLPKLWVYLYDENIFPARVYSSDLKSSANVPDGCSGVQFEIYSDPRKKNKRGSAELISHCEDFLVSNGLTSSHDIVVRDHRILPFGNVVFELGMESRRNAIRNWIVEQGVHLAGRFGQWDYFWSDQSLLSGKQAAEEVLASARRTVGWF
ncbi:protoporphyrinogen/coproporphyrinogen oxidase [Paraburkholderia sp. GAS348]|uniref:protoporphyrinogen/coproporphyrinogen oxidase n=1 Tax=Paraburkholderia sp. GAS348 TaxID=3035132 RepID=UPI003D2538EA